MRYLSDLAASCGAQHLPNTLTNRVRVYAAGARKDEVCPVDPKFDHVVYPPNWTVEIGMKDDVPAVLIKRGEGIVAWIVQEGAPGSYNYKLKTNF